VCGEADTGGVEEVIGGDLRNRAFDIGKNGENVGNFRLISGLLLLQNPWVGNLLYSKSKKVMITVSPNAKEYIAQQLSAQQAAPETFIRVGVKSGGCSGLEYKLDFDTIQKEGDQVFEDKGVRVVVDMKSLLYLYGTELDYSGGLNGKGLTFNNPNASRTCSCGESFSV
jgi:iron-sulfur cluster assembly protein